jgi:hypothetical protein
VTATAPTWLHRTAVGSTSLVAVGSGVLAFDGTASVAVTSGAVPAGLGWIVPLVIEAGVLAAGVSALNRAASGERPRMELIMMSGLLTLSTVVQIAHSASLGGSVLGMVLAGVVPAVLLASVELVLRAQRSAHHARTVLADQMRADARRDEERAARAAQRAANPASTPPVQSPAPIAATAPVRPSVTVSEPRHGLAAAPGHDRPHTPITAAKAPDRDPASDRHALITSLIAEHGASTTGPMVAALLGTSESQGRRLLAAHRSVRTSA